MKNISKIVFDVIRTRQFDRKAKKIWGAADLDRIIVDLAHNPESGAHLGGGLYKVRVGVQGRGKRGGARIIYLLITDDHQIYLLDAYAKNEKGDLTAAEYKILREIAENLRSKDHDKKKR
jgi:hypothetical protein